MSGAGKGSAPRPKSVPADEFARRWDKALRPKCPTCANSGIDGYDKRGRPRACPDCPMGSSKKEAA